MANQNALTTYSTRYKITPAVEQYFAIATPKERVAATIAAIVSSRSQSPDPEVIAKLSGWGSIKKVIWSEDTYPDLRAQLEALMSPEDMEFAKTGTFWAFHTSHEVVRYVWELVKKTGFNGGRILDSGCGSGNFFGCMPEFEDDCELYGVEIDPTPYRACKALYPEAHIANVDFRKFKWQKGYFDLAIGNVPFGDQKIYDDSVYQGGLSIHNYFLAKNLLLVREGGLVVNITSSFMLDNRDEAFRRWVSKQAELVCADALPDTAFKSFANTEVCADILLFRKFDKGEESPEKDPDWVKTVDTVIDGETVRVNKAIAEYI